MMAMPAAMPKLVATAADDDVAGDDNEEFQDAALQQPGDEPGDHGGGVAEIEVEEDSPEQPEGRPEQQEIAFLVKERFPKILPANRESEGPDYRRGKKCRKKRANGDGNERSRAGLEALLGGVHGT